MKKQSDIKLIIGLGNPGKEYEDTYHNIGHFFVDVMLQQQKDCFAPLAMTKDCHAPLVTAKCGTPPKAVAMTKDCHAESDSARNDVNKIVPEHSRGTTIKSNEYMNNSGLFVKKELKKLGLKPENLLIVHDDSDIELGEIKLCFGRGSAGHKGVQNIIDQLKTKDFWRLRVGIRPPEIASKISGTVRRAAVRKKASEFVLKKISTTNKKVFEKIFSGVDKKLNI